MQKIIGLTGLRGAGKDTVAQMLAPLGFERIAFADKLYQEVANAFGVPVSLLQHRPTKETPLCALALGRCNDLKFVECMLEVMPRDELNYWKKIQQLWDKSYRTLGAPRSPRTILQYWGTEYRRVCYTDSYWRDQVLNHIQAHPQESFVITDVRFPDEAKLVESMGGVVVRVVRPGLTQDPSAEHISERAMKDYPCHFSIQNEEGEQGLQETKRQAAVIASNSFLQVA